MTFEITDFLGEAVLVALYSLIRLYYFYREKRRVDRIDQSEKEQDLSVKYSERMEVMVDRLEEEMVNLAKLRAQVEELKAENKKLKNEQS